MQENYWTIICLKLTDYQPYQSKVLPLAKDWLLQRFYHKKESLVTELLTVFNSDKEDFFDQAQAILCLRCYVSHYILEACKILKKRYPKISFRGLLSRVLDDDGQRLIIFNKNKKSLEIDQNGNFKDQLYLFFTIKVIQTYDFYKQDSLSLKNWTISMTKRSECVKYFLLEYGIEIRSDWGILNRASSSQISQLYLGAQKIMKAYQQVYLRDRRRNKQRNKLVEPSLKQLQEMIEILKKHELIIKQPEDLLNMLKEISQSLREINVVNSTVSLENLNNRFVDIPYKDLSLENLESISLMQTIREQSEIILSQKIEEVIKEKINKLKKKGKEKFFISGLFGYYQQSLSLIDISTMARISIHQARRLFQPAQLIIEVREKTFSSLYDFLIDLGKKQGSISNNTDNNSDLIQVVEEYLDQVVFNAAITEIRAGKNRNFDSLYARKLISYLLTLEERDENRTS